MQKLELMIQQIDNQFFSQLRIGKLSEKGRKSKDLRAEKELLQREKSPCTF